MSFDIKPLEEAVSAHGRVARIVVAKIAGSVPRETGTAMLVWADGQSGTIGGGALEWDAVRSARADLETGESRLKSIPLGPSLGQCCGGHVTLVSEIFDKTTLSKLDTTSGVWTRRISGSVEKPFAFEKAQAAHRNASARVTTQLIDGWFQETLTTERTPLWIWGAGHVGRALILTLAPLPVWDITWLDTGHERFPDEIADCVTVLPAAELSAATRLAPPNAHHLILTYSHALDLQLCHSILGQNFASLGLIGSETKWARFTKRLAELGHSAAQINRISCPIGNPDLGKHPHSIAIGVGAALLSKLHRADRVRDVAL